MLDLIKDTDLYWLKKGQDLVDESLIKIENRRKSYLAYIDILSGLGFLGGVTTIILFINTTNQHAFALFLIPIIILQIVKFRFEVIDTQAIKQEIDFRSPDQIREVYINIITTSFDRLSETRKYLIFSVVIYLVLIPVSVYQLKQEPNIIFCDINVSATYLRVAMNLGELEETTLEVRGKYKPKTGDSGNKDSVIVIQVPLTPGKTNFLNYHANNLELASIDQVIVSNGDILYRKRVNKQ